MPTIVCLGDSLTGASDLSRFIKWSDLLQLIFDSRFGLSVVKVVNSGVAGDTTGGMRTRLERDVLKHRPEILVLLAGGNDAGKSTPRSETAANLNAICLAAMSGGSRILGLQYHIIPHEGREADAWWHLPTNNDLLAEAVCAHGGAICDTAAAMKASLRPPVELVAPDAVHLNPGGELIYATNIFSSLMKLNWIK